MGSWVIEVSSVFSLLFATSQQFHSSLGYYWSYNNSLWILYLYIFCCLPEAYVQFSLTLSAVIDQLTDTTIGDFKPSVNHAAQFVSNCLHLLPAASSGSRNLTLSILRFSVEDAVESARLIMLSDRGFGFDQLTGRRVGSNFFLQGENTLLYL